MAKTTKKAQKDEPKKTKTLPTFILHAGDKFALEALARYKNECINNGAPAKYVKELDTAVKVFREYHNKSKVPW